jgi:hypothetical protein
MSRTLKIAYLSVLALLLATFVAGNGAQKDAPKPEVKADDPLYVRLNRLVTFNGVEDPKVTLAEELDLLGTQHNILFDINERAFAFDMVPEVAKTQIAERPLPPMKNVRLETVLHKVLARVPAPSGATFTVRRDRVEITTNKFQQTEFWPKAPEDMEPVFPLVNASYDKKPLDEALKDLSERSEVTIVLDTKAAEKVKPVVTANLTNTPLDTAVQLLAEMSDLRSVAIGKTLFVTTAAKAKRLHKENHPMPGAPNGLGALGVNGALGQMGQLGFGALGFGGQLGLGAIGFGGPTPGNFRPRLQPGAGM